MRICMVLTLAAEENSEGAQGCKLYADVLRRNMDLVRQKDTEVTFRIPRWGLTGLDAFFYSQLHHLNDKETFHGVIQAAKDGFDAAMVSCFYDPVLRDLRQAVNIPVVGFAESSLLLATMMGAKLGVVSISPEATYEYEENICKYGLKERVVGVRPIPETAEVQSMALMDASSAIEAFKKVARELIADGADVLIPGCGLMSPALRMALGVEKKYPNGFTEIDGVPIVDVLGCTVKMAETMVALKQGGSSWISRKSFYAQPNPKALEFGQMVLKYDGPGFWDY